MKKYEEIMRNQLEPPVTLTLPPLPTGGLIYSFGKGISRDGCSSTSSVQLSYTSKSELATLDHKNSGHFPAQGRRNACTPFRNTRTHRCAHRCASISFKTSRDCVWPKATFLPSSGRRSGGLFTGRFFLSSDPNGFSWLVGTDMTLE